LALSRFALALRLTLETGMPIARALRLSLEATGNAAFVAATEPIVAAVRAGKDLTLALGEARRFPEPFLHMVAVAEEGGRVPEMMQHQAAVYQDEAERRLRALFRTVGWAVWLAYAVFMVTLIFRLASIYFAAVGG
jgi:type II secretory pathway component PulF